MVKSGGGERAALAAGRDTGQWRRWLLRRQWARPDEDTSRQRRRSFGARHEQAMTAMGTDAVDKLTNSHGGRLICVGSREASNTNYHFLCDYIGQSLPSLPEEPCAGKGRSSPMSRRRWFLRQRHGGVLPPADRSLQDAAAARSHESLPGHHALRHHRVTHAGGVHALWKGLTHFATHLTLKYALWLSSNIVMQSAFKDPRPHNGHGCYSTI